MIKKGILIIIMLLITLITSCINNTNIKEEKKYMINNIKDSFELITQTYDIDFLRKNIKLLKTIEEVNSIAKIECLRKVDNYMYSILKTTENGKYYIFYKHDEVEDIWITTDFWYSIKPLKKEDFNSILVGITTQNDIFQIDPATLIMYGGKGIFSFHILSDYSTIENFYNDKSILIRINYGVLSNDSIFRKILKIDWPT